MIASYSGILRTLEKEGKAKLKSREKSEPNENGERCKLRVRYFETDQMRRAHTANYFVWFEACRAEFCRARGIDYLEMEAQGLFLPISEATCRYLSPIGYDDEIEIYGYVIEMTRASFRIGYVITKGEIKVAEGETRSVLVNLAGKPVAFSEEMRRKFMTPRS